MKPLLVAVIGFLAVLPTTASAFEQASNQAPTPADLYVRSYTEQLRNAQPPQSSAEVRAQAVNDRYTAYDRDHQPVRNGLRHSGGGMLTADHLW